MPGEDGRSGENHIPWPAAAMPGEDGRSGENHIPWPAAKARAIVETEWGMEDRTRTNFWTKSATAALPKVCPRHGQSMDGVAWRKSQENRSE
jgi:hypothetical protein